MNKLGYSTKIKLTILSGLALMGCEFFPPAMFTYQVNVSPQDVCAGERVDITVRFDDAQRKGRQARLFEVINPMTYSSIPVDRFPYSGPTVHTWSSLPYVSMTERRGTTFIPAGMSMWLGAEVQTSDGEFYKGYMRRLDVHTPTLATTIDLSEGRSDEGERRIEGSSLVQERTFGERYSQLLDVHRLENLTRIIGAGMDVRVVHIERRDAPDGPPTFRQTIRRDEPAVSLAAPVPLRGVWRVSTDLQVDLSQVTPANLPRLPVLLSVLCRS